MSLKTFLYVVFLFVVIAAVALLAYANEQRVTIKYLFLPDIHLPLWSVIFLSFMLGLAVAMIWFLWRSSLLMFDRWRQKKTAKKEKKTEELFSQAKQLILIKDVDRAKTVLKQILEKDDNHLPALKCLGDLYRQEGQVGEAVRLLEKALALNGRDADVLLALAETYNRTGRHLECKEHLIRADNILGGSYMVKKKLQTFYLDRSELGSAQQNQQAIMALGLSEKTQAMEKEILSGIHVELALEREKKGDFKGAVHELKKIIKSRPLFVPAYHAVIGIYLKNGHDELALEEMEKGYKATKHLFFLKMMEQYYLDRESPEKAIDAYHKALLKADPSRREMELRYFLGSLYFRLEMIEESLREFNRISSEVQANDPRIQFYSARLHRRKQDYQKAYEKLNEFLEPALIWKYNYRCSNCGSSYETWQPRCGSCGAWNTSEFLQFQLIQEIDKIDGISSMPIYTPHT